MTDFQSTTTAVADGGEDAKLCSRCEQLDLMVDKFIIGNASATVAQDPQCYEARKPDATNFRLKSGDSWKNFARLGELRANRNTCSFCELVYKAINQYSHGNTSDEMTCSLTWEVDGRQVESSSRNQYMNSTRRIQLSWCETTGNEQEAYLVFVAPKDPLRPNSDAQSGWGRETHFLGREFGDQKEKHALIKSWLDLCVNNHSDACREKHNTEKEFMELVEETYFGVIDVVDMQLKALPIMETGPERYVALSYVWGTRLHDEAPYRTTRANVMTHILHGGLLTAWDKLPETIRDAILLVSRLGERYLWVDSLCIVQDSDISWKLNAKAMHLVYGHAYFTICAADGDSSAGLCAVKPVLRAMRPVEPLREALANMNLNGDQHLIDDYDSQPIIAECAPGVRLMVTRPLEAVVNDSKWNKRAWTFQERVLSRRCLVFAEGRVYFQCRSTGISQDIYTDGRGSGWSLDRTNSPLRTLRELQQRPLWFYMKYVSMYTSRDLTKPGDILAAFDGISWLLEQYMEAPSLFGIPSSHFDLALLWVPLKVLHRRRPEAVASSGSICSQNDLGHCTCYLEKDFFGGKEFPSWAWSGWSGAVEYQLRMIKDCLLNVREWLKFHTWIQWHIRDEKGHLRPLWGISTRASTNRRGRSRELSRTYSRPGSFEDEDRWKGYPGSDRQSTVQRGDSRRRHPSPDLGYSRSHVYGYDSSPKRVVHVEDMPPASPPPQHFSTSDGRQGSTYYSGNDHGNERVDNFEYIRARSSVVTGANPRTEHMSNHSYTQSRTRQSLQPSSRSPSPSGHHPYEDNYGRLIRGEIPKEPRPFHAILLDNPFGVIRENYPPRDLSKLQHMPILQFRTWRTELCVATRKPTADTSVKNPTSGLCQCDIVDKEGDWCGSIVLAEQWIREREGYLFQFIAISDAKAFTKEECPVWTYYIPKERDESEWDLYYVLMLERNAERGVWERAGLGKVFQVAFKGSSWEEIKLG